MIDHYRRREHYEFRVGPRTDKLGNRLWCIQARPKSRTKWPWSEIEVLRDPERAYAALAEYRK